MVYDMKQRTFYLRTEESNLDYVKDESKKA